MGDGADNPALTARTLASISEVDAADWNRLANPPDAPYNPFVAHEFLRALENSGSAAAETGWTPCHLALEEDGALVGAAPVYIKSHSYGEYVFDHHWADALERAGGRYYPKILCAAPFTPVPGPRLLAAAPARKAALGAAMTELATKLLASSVHVNFIKAEDADALANVGYLARRGVQYHWFNRGYQSYDDFLAALSSRKRKALRRERKDAAEGLTIRRVEGRDIDGRLWDAFWIFYQDTGARKWGSPYLTRAFFAEIAETMRDRLLMIVAEDRGRAIAGALNFIGGDALYGRYWGRIEDRPFLHFELCYHQAIDFAIERGLARVEAGAQGEHKVARGYEPVATHSAHWIAHPGFKKAISDYLEAERRGVDADIGAIDAMTPFRRTE
jgi:predicted N-acyltransferase